MRRTIQFRLFLGALGLGLLSSSAQADIFVYQIPGGARIVTDHALNNRNYKLVRHSRDSRGAGALVSGRSIQYAVTDPTHYDRLIQRTAAQHKMDPALIKAVMHVESAFNPHAVSHKGAQGLMQLIPETAQRYGVEDLFDPVQNVRAGVMYLRDLQKMFKNNTRLVLAAYNAGENAVLRHKGVPPYDETRGYVVKVMKMHRTYQAEQKAATANVASTTRSSASNSPAGAAPAASGETARRVPVAVIQPSNPVSSEKQL